MELNPKNISELLKVVSWQKILQVLVLMLIFIGSWVIWENRNIIYNSLRVGATIKSAEPLNIYVSERTKDYIDSSIKRGTDPIMGIQIVNVDFRKNSRSTAYFFIRDPILRREHELYEDSKIIDTPLFNESEINNQRLINLINGEFACTEFSKSISGRIYPNATTNITTVCGVSIPPYYGRFSGYLNIFLSREPTLTDLVYIKQISRDISLRVYEYDITPPVDTLK